ncbi:MAG: hypothetical protein AB7U61_00240 [Methylocystis sp.]
MKILGHAALLALTVLATAPSAPAQALSAPTVSAESALEDFFLGGPDIPPPDEINRQEELFLRYTGCDYRRQLAKLGDDIRARRACHGILFD